jgi:hypothetical protein
MFPGLADSQGNQSAEDSKDSKKSAEDTAKQTEDVSNAAKVVTSAVSDKGQNETDKNVADLAADPTIKKPGKKAAEVSDDNRFS